MATGKSRFKNSAVNQQVFFAICSDEKQRCRSDFQTVKTNFTMPRDLHQMTCKFQLNHNKALACNSGNWDLCFDNSRHLQPLSPQNQRPSLFHPFAHTLRPLHAEQTFSYFCPNLLAKCAMPRARCPARLPLTSVVFRRNAKSAVCHGASPFQINTPLQMGARMCSSVAPPA